MAEEEDSVISLCYSSPLHSYLTPSKPGIQNDSPTKYRLIHDQVIAILPLINLAVIKIAQPNIGFKRDHDIAYIWYGYIMTARFIRGRIAMFLVTI